MSSAPSGLALVWLDSDHVRFSETLLKGDRRSSMRTEGFFQWVDYDVARWRRLTEHPYTARLELGHRIPPKDLSTPNYWQTSHIVGGFEVVQGTLRYRGASEPLVPARLDGSSGFSEFCVSPDGRWAAWVDHAMSGVFLADGESRAVRKIAEGFYFQLSWKGSQRR
jgi:hypothetical protein